MTASTLTQLPLMAGSALLGSLGRAGLWTFSHYMKAPLASTGLLAMVTLTALAGSNALYFQTAEHPSPFFAPALGVPQGVAAPKPLPAMERPEATEAPVTVLTVPTAGPSAETTGSVTPVQPVIPEAPVGNAEVFAVQKKLAELQLFDGKVDGYYGPMTARAIRAFEERNGLTPMGALDPAVVQAILGADSAGRMTTPPPAATAPAAPQPQAAATPPAPPRAAPVQPAAVPAQDQLVARLPALSPAERALDEVATAAASTIDSIIAAVDGSRTPPAQMANPPIPTAALPAAQVQPMPAPVQSAPAPQVAVAATQPAAAPTATAGPPATDAALVMQIQRGLASLGFFHAAIDGKPGPETARAIREFENFHRYRITGQVQPDLVGLLREAGATI